MCCNLKSERMCFVTRCFDIVGRHLKLARFALYLCVEDAARNHELNPVGFVLCNLLHIIASLFGTCGNVCQRMCHMAALHGYRLV